MRRGRCFNVAICPSRHRRWDWALSLWFDWSIVTGSHKLSFATLVACSVSSATSPDAPQLYLLARYTTLAALAIGLRITNAIDPSIDCEVCAFAVPSMRGLMRRTGLELRASRASTARRAMTL